MSESDTNRLQSIQKEMALILEARLGELFRHRASEQVTRQIITTEMDIQRHQQRESDLSTELERLRVNHQQSEDELEEAKQRKQKLISQNAELAAELEEVRAEVSRYQETAVQLQTDLEDMETESKQLRNENAKLKLQVKEYSANIEGMKALRDERMLSVMQLTETMSQIARGKDEVND